MKSAYIYVFFFFSCGYKEKKKGFCDYAKTVQEAGSLAGGPWCRSQIPAYTLLAMATPQGA